MDNFDLRKYLVENKATTNSKMMNENEADKAVDSIIDKFISRFGEISSETRKKFKEAIYMDYEDTPQSLSQITLNDAVEIFDASGLSLEEDNLEENKANTDTEMIDEAEDSYDNFAFLDRYIKPYSDKEQDPELVEKVKEILDAYEISELEAGIDTFGEALLNYFNDYDPTWPGTPQGIATSSWDDKLLATVKAYKQNAIDLKTAVRRLRRILSDSKNYERR